MPLVSGSKVSKGKGGRGKRDLFHRDKKDQGAFGLGERPTCHLTQDQSKVRGKGEESEIFSTEIKKTEVLTIGDLPPCHWTQDQR